MAEFRRRVAQTLGLNLTLKPADDTKFVRAFLFDKDGAALIPPFTNLPSTGNGGYTENTRSMPNTSQVRADMHVYEDAAYTKESCEFLGDTDYFDLDDSAQETTVVAGKLRGILRATELTGILERDPDSLIGLLSNVETQGVLSPQKLTGLLSVQSLVGKIECD